MPTAPAPPGTEAFDRLAEAILEHAAPLRFGPIESAEDLDAALALRHAAALERRWVASGAFPDGRERDEYDAEALHVGAWDGDALVGTARIVLPAAGRRLPTEAAFDLVVEPAGDVVDYGRLTVAPAYRGDPLRRVPGGLFARSWQETRRAGYHILAGVTSAALITHWRSLGFVVHVLGDARPYHGEERHPIRMSVSSHSARAWLPSG